MSDNSSNASLIAFLDASLLFSLVPQCLPHVRSARPPQDTGCDCSSPSRPALRRLHGRPCPRPCKVNNTPTTRNAKTKCG
ncbi:hypothetical protein GE21DRAFT_1077043 [Neurospora crassa]|nr:hypothetical protein GE21DRAFT_1077043 [Neurospora crassa]